MIDQNGFQPGNRTHAGRGLPPARFIVCTFLATGRYHKPLEEAMSPTEVEKDLIRKLTADGLKREAEEVMFKNGDNSAMYGESGVIDHILGMKLLPYGLDRHNTMEAVTNVREHFKIPAGWVPPSIILRDALPHMVHLRRVLLPLTRGNIARREELVVRLGRLAREFETPDEAAAVGLEWLRSMVDAWTVDLPKS